MDGRALLQDLFGRIPAHIEEALSGCGVEDLTATVVPGTNSIGWLIWHLTRVQDAHMAELLERDQVWVEGDWAARFGVDPDPSNTGYGHDGAQVAAIQPDGPEALVDYYRTVAARTDDFIAGLDGDDLDRIVDEGWDPPVTLGVRMISIADDDIQHAGQAAYLRGLLHS